MNDGLMGEFAREKIDRAFGLLNQAELSDEDMHYCEQTISIVGEPIIKKQMQKMLDSKRLAKVDKIDELEAKISRLQQQLDELNSQ
jgi:polyhydroxyalkanoate synthesis regulator phasin